LAPSAVPVLEAIAGPLKMLAAWAKNEGPSTENLLRFSVSAHISCRNKVLRASGHLCRLTEQRAGAVVSWLV
jgi:hypothetical protein